MAIPVMSMLTAAHLVTHVLYLVGRQGAVGLGHVAGGEDLGGRKRKGGCGTRKEGEMVGNTRGRGCTRLALVIHIIQHDYFSYNNLYYD